MSYQDRYFPKFLSRNTERFYIFFVKWHKTNLLWGVVFIRRISEDFENSRHEACSNSLCRLSEIWPRRRKAKMCYHAGLLEFLLKFMKLVSLVFVFRFQQLHSLQIESFEQKTHLKNTKDFFFSESNLSPYYLKLTSVGCAEDSNTLYCFISNAWAIQAIQINLHYKGSLLQRDKFALPKCRDFTSIK